MRKLVIALLLLTSSRLTLGQSSTIGAYEGELISLKNVLIINQQKDSILSGAVYTTKFDKFPFYGVTKQNNIRGTIMLPPTDGDVLILIGSITKDTIYATLISSLDSTEVLKSKLIKVSKNKNYDLENSFGKIDPQFDPELIAKWTFIHSIKVNGEITSTNLPTMMVEYFPNGTWQIHSQTLDNLKNIQGFKQNEFMTMTWFTYQGKLSTKIQIHMTPGMTENAIKAGIPPPPDKTESLQTYKIYGDTLVTTSENLTKNYYLRK